MSDRTLYVRLNNRLGNQLFQYAFARSMMPRLGICRCYLVGQDPCRLGCFSLSNEVQFVSEADLPFPTRLAAKVMGKLASMFENYPAYLYRVERFAQPLIRLCGVFFCLDGYLPVYAEKLRGNVLYCAGYFQSEYYFFHYRDLIRQELVFSIETVQSCFSLAHQISSCNAVCLHVRMGDYMTSPRHSVCGRTYYQQAIALMRELQPDARFFLFSDEPERASQLLHLPEVTVIPSTYTDQQSLYLGTLCHHHILTNSSFSWWMQYLAQRDDQVVIAPSRWMNDQTPIALYDSHWHLLDT